MLTKYNVQSAAYSPDLFNHVQIFNQLFFTSEQLKDCLQMYNTYALS